MKDLVSQFSMSVTNKQNIENHSYGKSPVLKRLAMVFSCCLTVLLTAVLSITVLQSNVQAESLNLAPECSQAGAVPNTLWPPNSRMASIQIQGVTDPENQPLTIETQCISQDEPISIWHWYIKRYDGDGLSTKTPIVRASRKRLFFSLDDWKWVRSKGRFYEIIFKATDSEGAACTGVVNVGVPLSKKQEVVDNGYRFASLPGGENCQAEPFNNPPLLYSEPRIEAQANTPYSYILLAHDPDQETLQYTVSSGPDGLILAPQTGAIVWTPTAEQVGVHSVIVIVTDEGGLEDSQTFEITVQPAMDELSAEIIANPVTGTSPLTVRFSPKINNNNIVITGYSWDFNGDGTADRSDSFGAPQTYTYTGTPGETFEAALTVTPSGGEPLIATRTITIANQPPSSQVNATVTNGHAPLAVTFIVSAQDPQGIDTVTIDFEGDGIIDETVNANGTDTGRWSFATTYENEGVFVAVVTVTDMAGGQTVITNNAISADVNNPLDPVIQLSASPQSGNVPLATTLSVTAELFDNSNVSTWEWDLDGDGTFEIQGGSDLTDNVSHTYNSVDTFYPVARITTDTDRMAQASIQVTSQSSSKPQLSIPNSSDTINSDLNQTASINITLPYETELEVWIENANGSYVATVQTPQLTAAGTYTLAWDGTDEQGLVVAEGDYYVVLGYTASGIQETIDLRTSTGGQLSYYRRTQSNPRTFDRLKSPLVIDYAVDDPAEVTFFWQISFGARLMTLMEHERMGRGQYSLYWNGEYPNGLKLPSNVVNLMPGILRYTLPDNVVFVKENPRIEEYTLASAILTDPRREPITMYLTLSKTSTIEMVVSDMDRGVDVATRVYPDVTVGEQSISWDGKNNDDQYLAPGDYRIGLRSIDSYGNRSLFWYRTQRIEY